MPKQLPDTSDLWPSQIRNQPPKFGNIVYRADSQSRKIITALSTVGNCLVRAPPKNDQQNKQGLPCTSKVAAQTAMGVVGSAALLPDCCARMVLDRRVQLDE